MKIEIMMKEILVKNQYLAMFYSVKIQHNITLKICCFSFNDGIICLLFLLLKSEISTKHLLTRTNSLLAKESVIVNRLNCVCEENNCDYFSKS